MFYVLIPGAGGSAWYWHRVVPLLQQAGAGAIAVELPAADDSMDLVGYADIVCAAVADVEGPLTVVGQSMGALVAPIVASRVPTASIVLVNPMVSKTGEAPGDTWEVTGRKAAQIEYFREIGLDREEFDEIEDFFHDVPTAVRDEAMRQPQSDQSGTPFSAPWPVQVWPDVPTRVLAGSEDRLFPLDYQRRVVRERLGLDVELIPGGHLAALSRPEELAAALLAAE